MIKNLKIFSKYFTEHSFICNLTLFDFSILVI
jgi:hypothetical protein